MTKSAPPPAAASAAISPGLRRFLYATAAITGAAILIVEILGAKMLSPYVGTSHFVWTAQIAVTLLSLATGYYFGGWLVDRSMRLSRIYYCIAAAAVYLALTILVVEDVAYAFVRLNLAIGALVSSAVLFFVPLTLLAAVGPFFVRVLALSFHTIGSQVGRLSALSTVGSVLGTILIGYVLIPFLPNSVTMFLTAGVLLAVCAAYFIGWSRKDATRLALLTGITVLLSGGGIWREQSRTMANVTELYHRNSDYGLLQVIESKRAPKRWYLNDFLVQNSYDFEQKKSLSLFTYMLHLLARGYTPELRSALCIGLGVGIAPMKLAEDGAQVDAVEINPGVVEVGRRFFDLDPTKMNLTIGDGRYFLIATPKKYDAVLLDAFLGDSSPSHLMTREAFGAIRNVLNPNGVLVINSFGDFQPGKSYFMGSLFKTLTDVFATVRIHANGNGNVFFVASDARELALRPVALTQVHPELVREVESCLNAVVTPPSVDGRVLTDDFNPVEFFDAPNREAHRRRLALSVKNL